ncbi:MAG: hypothetical protein JWL80_121 [Parcubacteria group bacterium]|nr:hypothetical protein [Parcubacteria group bacterium]
MSKELMAALALAFVGIAGGLLYGIRTLHIRKVLRAKEFKIAYRLVKHGSFTPTPAELDHLLNLAQTTDNCNDLEDLGDKQDGFAQRRENLLRKWKGFAVKEIESCIDSESVWDSERGLDEHEELLTLATRRCLELDRSFIDALITFLNAPAELKAEAFKRAIHFAWIPSQFENLLKAGLGVVSEDLIIDCKLAHIKRLNFLPTLQNYVLREPEGSLVHRAAFEKNIELIAAGSASS